MALLWVDGFDGYGDSNNYDPLPSGVLADKYRWVGYENQMHMFNDATYPRWGSGGGWHLGITWGGSVYSCAFDTDDLTTNDTMIQGVAIRINNKDGLAANHQWPILAFKNDNGDWNAMLLHVKGTFIVIGPDCNTFIGSCRVNLERFTWHYIEMKVKSHQTAGEVEVRVNGCPVLQVDTVNTMHTSGKVSSRGGLGRYVQPASSQYMRVDDYYICDGSGNTCNDFLGNCRIETLWPTADDTVNWTTTANGADHYDNIDRTQRDGTTDYVEEASSNVSDLFTLEDTGVTWNTIHGVCTWTAAEYDGSNAGLQQLISSNGTVDYSANITLTTDVLLYGPHAQEVDPDTGNSWNATTVNAIKTGFRTAP